eukprot:7084417-Pyramimonas_sp.AAC.1
MAFVSDHTSPPCTIECYATVSDPYGRIQEHVSFTRHFRAACTTRHRRVSFIGKQAFTRYLRAAALRA